MHYVSTSATVESKTLFLCNRYWVCGSDSKVWRAVH